MRRPIPMYNLHGCNAPFRVFTGLLAVLAAALMFILAAPAPSGAQEPTFTIVHKAVTTAKKNEKLPIEASIQPADKVSIASVYYRKAGNISYRSAFMKRAGGNTYRTEIPKEEITDKGIEYYILVVDTDGNEHLLFARPDKPQFVSTKSVAIVLTKRQEIYEDVLTGIRENIQGAVTEYNMKGQLSQGQSIIRSFAGREDTPDVIIAVGLEAALAAKEEAGKIPVVFTMVATPNKYELKSDTMTGLSHEVPVKNQLTTFKAVVPNIKKVGVLFDPDQSGGLIEQARFIAPSKGFDLLSQRVSDPKDVANALRGFTAGIDALWIVRDKSVITPLSIKLILDFCLKYKIPTFVFAKILVEAGALVSLEPDYQNLGVLTAEMANKIMEGTSPSNLPIGYPEKLRVAINFDTAKAIGVEDTVAKEVILYAAEKNFPVESVKTR